LPQFTTMYGRVLGVKILIFGTLLLLGAANQFWLHPRASRHCARPATSGRCGRS